MGLNHTPRPLPPTNHLSHSLSIHILLELQQLPIAPHKQKVIVVLIGHPRYVHALSGGFHGYAIVFGCHIVDGVADAIRESFQYAARELANRGFIVGSRDQGLSLIHISEPTRPSP